MTTFSGQVAAATDDAHEADDGTGFNDTAVTMRCEASTTSSSRWNNAFRIDNVTVPPGATITDAYASVVFPVGTRDSPDLDLDMEASDDAPDFSASGNEDVTSRTLTGNSVNWSGTDLGSGSFVDSPSFVSAVQTVVDRAGWASGQAMVVVSKGENATAQESGCRYTPYDSVTADACKLTIEYSTGIEGTLAATLGDDTLSATGISAGVIPVTLNGYLFSVAWDSYDQPRQKSQEVGFGLTGKMLIQNFSFVDYRWTMDLLVWETETRAGYGDLDDLRTAYALNTFDYIDLEGNSHTVVMQGELPSKNLEPSDVYKIPVSLREYQT